MMEEPIDETYFNWLCAQVKEDNTPNYMELLRILHRTEFVWVVPGDMNRSEDGVELRLYFTRETGIELEREWYSYPCSILEMLIAFADRAEFQTGDISRTEWFWQFITNLKLEDYRRASLSDRPAIEEILHNFVWRKYKMDGQGGLFPLRRPSKDQREVELWYQFFEYIEDHNLVVDI